MNETTVTNPYVGPRTFSYEQRHLFFGREREARDLTARFLSERLLLFYAQSGAGKSSLLQTRIIPQLREEREFGVLPVARVSGDLLPGMDEVDNIYVFNLMTSIDDGPDPSRLASVSISDFLARLVYKEGKQWVYDASIVPEPAVEQPRRRYALIVDQFEEIVTAHPSRWSDREDFFRQLEEAMVADPNLWVMLTLREDYVAALDPYANLMTDRLRARFYMERMGVEAALEAVQRPANEAGGRPFAAGVADKLVDDLRQVRAPGQEGTVPGQHVEPVQLQVVCYQLWEKLKDRPPGPISIDDLAEAGDVDLALAGFYVDAIKRVVGDSTNVISERALRGWFDAHMITEAGTRGSVYQGRRRSAGMPNAIVESLANQFLLRRELRAGGAWIELVHDRFVEPIRQSNREWIERQSPLMRAARDWENRGRSPELLLAEAQLEIAQLEAADESDPLIVDYLAASEKAVNAAAESRRRQAELEQARLAATEAEARRQAQEARAQEADARRKKEVAVSKSLRRMVMALVIITLFAGTIAVTAAWLNRALQNEQDLVAARSAQALAAEATAVQSEALAIQSAATAEAERASASNSAALAIQSAATALAAQQIAESERASANELAANLAAVLTAQAPIPSPTATPKPLSLSIVLTLIPDQQTKDILTALDTVLIPSPTPSPTPTPNLNATAVVVTAQAQLAQVQATQTAVAVTPEQSNQALPFENGVVISFGGAGGDYLLADPNDSLSGISWVPIGTPVTLLEEATGDASYGSGVWYLVEVPDPDDNGQRLKGYLPQEVLAAIDIQHQDAVDAQRQDADSSVVNTSPGTTPTPISWPPAGSIVYASEHDGQNALTVIRPYDGETRRLTSSPGYLPTYSDGGGLIAFTTERNIGPETVRVNINLIRPDGSNGDDLGASNWDDWDSAISPDGRTVAFVSTRENRGWEIYAIDVDSRSVTRLTDHQARDYSPAWTADGRRIVFASERDGVEGASDIWVMDADGSNQTQLTFNDFFDGQPRVSPDNTEIVFASDRDGNRSIYVMEMDGGNVRQLTTSPSIDQHPAWSADGDWVIFDRLVEPDSAQVFAVDRFGEQVKQITSDSFNNWGPIWVPE